MELDFRSRAASSGYWSTQFFKTAITKHLSQYELLVLQFCQGLVHSSIDLVSCSILAETFHSRCSGHAATTSLGAQRSASPGRGTNMLCRFWKNNTKAMLLTVQEWSRDDQAELDQASDAFPDFAQAVHAFVVAVIHLVRAASRVRDAGPRHVDIFFFLYRWAFVIIQALRQ